MSRVLIISVGTGFGSDPDAIESLSNGISFSIETTNPDKVIFVTSLQSKEGTLPHVINRYPNLNYSIIELSTVDNIQRIFQELRPVFEEAKRIHSSLYVDITSGTKAMTSCLAMLGVLYEAQRLCNVVGERKNGLVQRGTETLQSVTPLFAIAEKKAQTAIRLFNSCQYSSALDTLNEISADIQESSLDERLQTLRKRSLAYLEWDRFNHEQAWSHLKQLKGSQFNDNKRFLGTLLRLEESERGPYYIADLMNNAERRGEIEGKFDDAVARLYRVIELLAQHRLLKEYDVDTSRVDLKSLPDTLQKEWKSRQENGMLKIGLSDSYRLLTELGDDLGILLQDSKMRNILSHRNFSILAHGITPIHAETYSEMKNQVIKILNNTIEGMENLLHYSKFPIIKSI